MSDNKNTLLGVAVGLGVTAIAYFVGKDTAIGKSIRKLTGSTDGSIGGHDSGTKPK